MDERVLTPITSIVLVVVAGMVAGHVLMPALPTATFAQRAGYVATLVAAGALGGWRTGRVLAVRRAGGVILSMAVGIALALALAWAAFAVVHGS